MTIGHQSPHVLNRVRGEGNLSGCELNEKANFRNGAKGAPWKRAVSLAGLVWGARRFTWGDEPDDAGFGGVPHVGGVFAIQLAVGGTSIADCQSGPHNNDSGGVALLRPWESTFLDLHRQVDEMFETLVYRPWAISGRSGWRIPLDLYEVADAFHVVIDVPDVDPEELKILVGERDVTIAGRRTSDAPERVLSQRCERPIGAFERTLTLPQSVDANQAGAEYRHGTCRIRLPKKQVTEEATEPTGHPVERTRTLLRVVILETDSGEK